MYYIGYAVHPTFDAVRDTLSCNCNLPVDRRWQFGIGANLGDVIETRGDSCSAFSDRY